MASKYESKYNSDEDENEDIYEVLPELQLQLESVNWFHPYLTRHQSDAILQTSQEGVYLLRKRSRGGWGRYSLDIKGKQSVKHFPVALTERGVSLGSKLFDSVHIFLTHFQSNPVIADESGSFLECKFPYPQKVNEFEEYNKVTCHFLYGDDDSDEDDETRVGYSAATKEGYIKKQGGQIKSWKTRWFVLKDANLSYYSNHKSKKPIKVIPVDKIVHILGDDPSKCFR
ncbi:PREDICTED: dual adapter for phosphotyrosine and 3-phosphotyrosine and 3-phosphoinositide-like [Amphimedon queenslandica]|uniref:SH2 domain-containing protein n=1 Tax=Amphimedon queenslandica TaxID=400682 RepID=A0A1X7TJK3_AMPQE|nr:PREDICTED: dual adapter for phosphotyrosine and 3-phosphotyrosine and 3-phosphoinositide-like [Amphimedon queenslandica]XP_019859322.1 PREDICTED: dual adapter for phosphotyrosine and 3-phosphotyrosine and 3-phosphoinositide-like [Amphimedon queenslandica]|eukprot:XP_011407437.1 PREDICTED: dual adapter for phosphotyrosine and 3-phosphotyrosine and 3-phosphoinositide-like [Amphimedon queenslandica]